MYMCYVDESGCTGSLPAANSTVQPVFSILGLAVPADKVESLTNKFIHLKKRFYPGRFRNQQHHLDTLTYEIKGSDIRHNALRGSRRERRHANGVLDKTIELLGEHDAALFARVYIKGVGLPFAGHAIYPGAVQKLCQTFQRLLDEKDCTGAMIADSRTKRKNASVSHSVFTQKYKSGGDPYPNLVEVPTFGHSDNHAGLQLADWICSGILYPVAAQAYCTGHVTSNHVVPRAADLRARFGRRLRALEFRYWDSRNNRPRGGFTVADAIGQRNGSLLFPTGNTSNRVRRTGT